MSWAPKIRRGDRLPRKLKKRLLWCSLTMWRRGHPWWWAYEQWRIAGPAKSPWRLAPNVTPR